MPPTDNQSARFERGFKTWAENTALAVRTRLKLSNVDPLSCEQLAAHLDAHIWDLSEISELPLESFNYLTKQGGEWSALTVTAAKTVIVLNPTHSSRRRSSSGMHELAHILRGHEPARVTITPGGLTLRDYNALQEAEADWLAGCLLLPRPALEYCLKSGVSEHEVCNQYNVSSAMYNYRIRMTGVERQLSRHKQKVYIANS